MTACPPDRCLVLAEASHHPSPRHRHPQLPQHIPHQLRPVLWQGQFAFNAQLLVRSQFDVPVFLDQLDDAHGLDRRVLLERDDDHARRGIHLHHAVGLAQGAQAVCTMAKTIAKKVSIQRLFLLAFMPI